MVQNVTRIKNELIRNHDVGTKTQKDIKYAERIIFGIVLHIVVKIVNI